MYKASRNQDIVNQYTINMSSIENLKGFDPFADNGDDESTITNYVHVRVQQRNGRKTLTTVQGIPFEFDLKRILKVLKRDFACNGHIVKDEDMGEIIQLQGDQRSKICDFMLTQLGFKKNIIKVHGF